MAKYIPSKTVKKKKSGIIKKASSTKKSNKGCGCGRRRK